MKLLNIFLIFVLLSSCSSLDLKVNSDPQQASVFVKDGIKKIKVGETPADIPYRNLPDLKNYVIVVEKEGYSPYEIVLEKKNFSARADIYAQLESKPQVTAEREVASLQKAQNETIALNQRTISQIQALLLKTEYEQAESALRNFLLNNPESAVGWSLLGNSFLLRNRNQEALEAYYKALEYDPDDAETQKLVQKLTEQPLQRGR